MTTETLIPVWCDRCGTQFEVRTRQGGVKYCKRCKRIAKSESVAEAHRIHRERAKLKLVPWVPQPVKPETAAPNPPTAAEDAHRGEWIPHEETHEVGWSDRGTSCACSACILNRQRYELRHHWIKKEAEA